ncbi:MAG: shikimate dehydrogenase [Chitinophagaceae bacterium]|nr:shikimate dehydrogenase [Chitinophagaceae bacterium]
MVRYGIIGNPLTHSFSQRYFTEKFMQEGLHDRLYEQFPLSSIDELPGLIDTRPDLAGLNVTIPFKRSVLDLLDDTSAIPDGLKACNCIRISEDRKLSGYNTDVIGFERSLIPNLREGHHKALVLGTGGASAAVRFVLQKNNIGHRVVSRDPKNREDLSYRDLNRDILEEYRLIINTTPLGTYPELDACPDLPYEFLDQGHFLYDLVYNPEKTLFLAKGEERGAFIKNGYEMLIIQAEESWKIWNAY